ILFSCEKTEIPEVDFDVTTERTSWQAGEEVTFTFSGNAGFIQFYSGEFGNDYAFRSGRILETKSASMSFQSRVEFGAQKDQFSVHLSSDFSGNYTIEDIHAATWIDVSDRLALGTTAVFSPSGTLELADIVDREKPLYVGFRYMTK